MPRLQPPEGYLTARDAAARLGVSDALLSRYVKDGRLHRYGPPERKHKFYKVSEVEALLQSERVFAEEHESGDYRNNPSSTYGLATEQDMPILADLGARALGYALSSNEIRVARLRKNPESYQVVRNQDGVIVAYTSILVLNADILSALIHDNLKTSDITSEKVEAFEPGRPLQIYILAMCVDPSYSLAERRGYGARLIFGLFTFLFDLAMRGIEIESITARSWTKDGIRLLRHMNIPQLRSSVPGKNLFSVRIVESGIPLLVRYSELLEQWKNEHS